ncbi:MAG: outer membrane beta-barrel protein [Bacteroidales bacterium]|nr:outer membrane beta-barrel protein [Bacteroidales bacterium]
MRKTVFFLFALIALNASVFAQNKVSGKIVDEATNQGVPFVNLGLFRVADSVFVCGAASDDKGAFVLQSAPQGEMELKISAIGYEAFSMPVTVKGDVNVGTLKLKAGTLRLDEVVIAEKRPLFAVEGEKTMYNTAEDPSIQTGTLSDALQNAPGVQVDVEGNITLRGTSSVEVWINDKPSHMNSENLKTYIQQMPANSIDHVEVITNPSARYGSKADGIINIVTNAKVQKNEFFSFGVNGSTRPSVSPWMSYVWSNDKLTFNAYINGGYSIWKGNSSVDQTLFSNPQNPANHEIDSSRYQSNSYNTGGYFSLDYEIDTANSLNFWVSGWPNWSSSESNTHAFREEFLDANGIPWVTPFVVDYGSLTTSSNSNYFVDGGVYYQHKFDNKGHYLSVSANAMSWGYQGSGLVDRRFTLPVEYRRAIQSSQARHSMGGEVEVVYNRPYSENGEISVGWNTGYSPEKVLSVTDTLVGEDDWARDVYRSYDVTFTTLTNEAFVTVQHKFGNFTVKPGIRFCHELVGGTYVDSTQYDFSTPFFSLRPSLHLSYRTESMHNFNLSYTRRIAAPDAHSLSRFPLYDEDEFSTGNPDLDRVYTNSIEAGWTKFFMKFGSVGLSAYYHGKSNEVSEIQLSKYHWLYGRVVPYSYPVNMGKSHSLGLEYNMMYRPNAFFNLRFNASLYDSYIKTLFGDKEYEFDTWSYSFRMNLWAKLWNKIEVTASGYYSSPTQSLFSERHANYGINAGLRADFFDRKMSVFVNANDIFNWNSWGYSNSSPYVESTTNSKFNSRSVSVGLTFRFGKMELERRARQGADDSQGAPQGAGMGM